MQLDSPDPVAGEILFLSGVLARWSKKDCTGKRVEHQVEGES